MSWLEEFNDQLSALEAAHLTRRRRSVLPEGGARISVDGKSMLAFCTNDYLGVAGHPALKTAVHEAVDLYGVGAGASPLVSGYSPASAALEHELATFVQLPRALYFYAGYSTNASIVPALVGPDDVIFSDSLNHACLIDGARLSKARIRRFDHKNLAGLAHQLADETARRRLILTDAVFSMDGDVANVAALVTLAEQYDALLLIDDAHGFGLVGPQGRGSLAAVGLTGEMASPRVLYMATLGKALGVAGAFVAGPEVLIEWLLQKTRSYIFATAAPALLAQALRASLRLVASEEGDARRVHLTALIARLRQGLAPGAHPDVDAAGWRLLESRSAIQPLVIGDNAAALEVMRDLALAGFWVPAIRPPTVPANTARLRITLTAAHRLDEVDQLVSALQGMAAAHCPA